jgi:hypothetical protein
MRRAIRERLGGSPKPSAAPPGGGAAAKPHQERAREGGLLSQLFTFRLRIERGGDVIYRKHWFILWWRLWRPTLAMLAVLVAAVLAAVGLLPLGLSLPLVVLGTALLVLPLGAWWLYEYVDWRNDMYTVSADQISAISKKPLGQETRKAAPLANILSLKYERPGLLGILLNYGTVVAQIAGAEFRFDGVYDPVGVQNDVSRRIETFNARQAAAETARRSQEMADWLKVYHSLQDEGEPEPVTAPSPPAERPAPEAEPTPEDVDYVDY